MKSVLITRFAHPVLSKSPGKGTVGTRGGQNGKVLDMGCGKGGDMTKWVKARVKEYYGVGTIVSPFINETRLTLLIDIAANSVDQARMRWDQRQRPFDAKFAALDCYTEPLSKAFTPAMLSQPFDVVSMQFCMHYAFETLQKVRCMLENVSKYLRTGGIFIGTVPNAEFLL